MEIFKFSIKHIHLPVDAKEIKLEYLQNHSKTKVDTYIQYFSESNSHKSCIYVVEGRWKILEDKDIKTNKLLKDLPKSENNNNLVLTLIELE